ncbi:MAG: flagellar biosynthetic protein FliO [Phycisphaerales bacterium]|nr:flagellar biosynthetic protein FliO [Phycisphaerales bacterium]MCB9857048.1 flagellar biosynthetic protein FliO [Phycisphaerales bacterium]MCB9861825.1 flagellar biosynthetic protein FliO [Phycisphaerales bacterium]
MIKRIRPQQDRIIRAVGATCVSIALFVAWSSVRADGEANAVHINAPASVSAPTGATTDGRTSQKVSEAPDEQPIPRRPSELSRRDDAERPNASSIRLPKTGLIETFWPMLAVLGLIVACVAAVKKWLPQTTRITGGNAVNILARQYLSSKQSLCLVKVGRRVVLVGVTPESMSSLTEIDDPEEIASLAASMQRGKSESFSSALAKQSFESEDDTAALDEGRDVTTPARRPGRLGETEARIQDLVGRIRALSGGSTSQTQRRP